MCFSATASFATAGVTGLVGIATLAGVGRPQEVPLAAMPLIFAAQQMVEGLLWLTLPTVPESPLASELTQSFLVLALILWPIYAPFAAYMAEPELLRRRILAVCLAVGALVAAFFLTTTIPAAPAACISGGHIVYLSAATPLAISIPYLLATGGALIASSHRAVSLLGWLVTLGSIVSYVFYWNAFLSVWCFFAAGASIVLLVHFERVRAARAAS